MQQVQIRASGRAFAGVRATARRIEEALAAVGVDAAVGDGPPDPSAPALVVDPAAWFAEQPMALSRETLARLMGFSLAPYGSVTLQDDATVGEHMAVLAHPEERCAQHLTRVGCHSRFVPLGARAAAVPTAAAPPLDIVTLGPPTARRLELLARGAAWLDLLRCAHHFDLELPETDADHAHPLRRARILVDVTPAAAGSPDLAAILAAWESGVAVVTDSLGPVPAGEEQLLRGASETLFARAAELSADPARAVALAAAGLAAWSEQIPLRLMGAKLIEALEDARVNRPVRPGGPPVPSAAAAPVPPPRSVLQILRDERAQPDATLRAGLQEVVGRTRALERRLAGLESGGPDDAVTEVVAGPARRGSPRVSVLIPAYAACRTLEETLDSVASAALEGGAPAVEIVLVDDASPQDDAALAVAWAAGRTDLPVTVLRHRRNRGLSASRNAAAEHAAGELLLTLDADDLLRRNGLTRLVAGLDADPGASFAYGILQRFDVGGPIGLVGLHPWSVERFRGGNYVPALALIRREALMAVGGYHGMPWGYEDWDLWCRMAKAGHRGVWVPEIVASYRLREDSMSAGLHLSHLAPLGDMLTRHPELLA
ncbi:glycosyltransferase [Paraconexibacter antarcticus]|uniref:Glycosyltransferase n=1 Tax=Paraconexibacter antarcticus TaxID=2949664 RepID=A0ABY5DU06_9ACTN|nr:glycosyltransferase family A protein [Paraconexibacter antarcticus]UTI65074.1 glycosyltransferase [Paraconexibacter antarcticus]